MCSTLNHSCVIAYLWQLTSTHCLYFHCGVRCRRGTKCTLADQGPRGIWGLSAASLFLFACWQDLVWFTMERVCILKWIPLQAIDIELHNSISWHIKLQLGCRSFLKPSSHCHSNKLHPKYSWKFFSKKESVSTPNLGLLRILAGYVYQLALTLE